MKRIYNKGNEVKEKERKIFECEKCCCSYHSDEYREKYLGVRGDKFYMDDCPNCKSLNILPRD